MLTFFTKVPLPPGINSVLLERYGYKVKLVGKRLETTVNDLKYNQLKGELGFKIEVLKDKINLITANNEIVAY